MRISLVLTLILVTLLAPAGLGADSAPAGSPAGIAIGSRKQLFFDHKFIDRSENVQIVMNPPKKLGPVFKPDRRWEDFRFTSYFTVLQDGDIIRMYYSCFAEDQWNNPSSHQHAFLCYAESRDGLHWEKPNLGIVEYNGSKDNNIIARSIVDGTVFVDPIAPPQERYRLLYTVMALGGGLRLASSADGIHFRLADKPLIAWEPDSQQNAFYDRRLGKYVAYLRVIKDMNLPLEPGSGWRRVARVEMADFSDWSSAEPRVVFRSDETDPPEVDFYTNACVQYAWADDAYFMFPAAYHHFDPKYGNDGLLDSSAAASRDGIQWQRVDRRPYIELGQTGDFDSLFVSVGVGLVKTGDKILQYYSGMDFGHGGTRKASKYSAKDRRQWGWIGAVQQRLDGFYSADAAYSGGWLTTPVVVFEGDRLHININTSAAGSAKVELRDADNRPIPGYTLDEADKVMTNAANHTVTWNDRDDVSKLAGQPVRLHFQMRSAKLYAFQFSNTKKDGAGS